MRSMTVLLFLVSAAVIAMACVRANRVRAWREALNPSAPEIPDSSFTVARVVLLAMAALGIYYGFHSISLADDAAWSDDELTSAVSGATDDLDGDTLYAGPYEDPSLGSDGDYGLKIEDAVAEHGGGDAPGFGVDAETTAPSASHEAYYTVTADGTPAAFCLHVRMTRDKSGDYDAPGIVGKPYPQRAYVFRVTSGTGEC
ncbi:hypothetical protein [Streptomyces sp. NRRL B-3648]|uniref:hypothetical protein n=1 Tax=Streptomyces sp. NRRL B-3648 TaxID=1519493 RepID=UPI0006AEA632|nr:hypothetical protein [Streptomyces sp. NRRL B-3648]KOV93140.1 hypothetical protein ADL04_28150 [Streptomyces sp. NRRL B-3648]